MGLLKGQPLVLKKTKWNFSRTAQRTSIYFIFLLKTLE